MKKFNLKNISEEDIFIGDILIIEKIYKNLLDKAKEKNSNLTDFSFLCYKSVAKKDAILIKIDDYKYIDLDGINSNRDIEIINELLCSDSKNNNIILSIGTNEPYIGQLYVNYITLSKSKKVNKILEKKLNTLN